jgi:hypothetical protein
MLYSCTKVLVSLLTASLISFPLMAKQEYSDYVDFQKYFDNTHSHKQLQDIIKAIPSGDKQALESLFRLLFSDGDFAYTLFGAKPMALVDFNVTLGLHGPCDQSTLYDLAIVYKGWIVWQKYKSSFPLNSFTFMDYASPDLDLIGFVLFNNEKVSAIYDKHKSLMTSVFGDKNQLATQLCSHKMDHLWSKCNYHEALGLLLGYAEVNVKRFCEKNKIVKALSGGPFSLEGLNPQSTKHVLYQREDGVLVRTDFYDFSGHTIEDIIQRLNVLSANLKPVCLSRTENDLFPISGPNIWPSKEIRI